MKAGPIPGGLALILAALFFLVEIDRSVPVPATEPPRGGAWKAFEWWYTQRAYPHTLIPPRGYRDAYAQKAAIATLKRDRGSAAMATPPWESIGPDNIGGRVLSIAIHPENTNIVYAGSASGGLWKSTTGGEGPSAWSYVPTGFPVLSVSAIAIDDAHPDTIYIGTGEISRYQRPLVGVVGARSSYGLGILKSTDGGVTWNTTGLSWTFGQATAIQKIVINPQNRSTVFAATSEGIYRSTDAGDSWTVSNGVLMGMDLVIHPADTTILISAHGNLNSSPDPGLYMTFDGGSNWVRLEGGLPGSNFGRTSLSLSPSDPSIIYAGISNASTSGMIGLYQSTNGGLTWSLKSTTNYVGSQGWYDNIIAVHPANPWTVYCGGLNIHKTTDAGATLPQISAGSVHVDQHAIAFDPLDTNTVYFGCDGGMYKTTDGGITFLDLNKGFVTTQFYPGFANAAEDSTVALGGLQDNGTLRYAGSPSWVPVWGGDGGWCAIDPFDHSTMYAETQYGRIVRSYNGGFSFTQVTLGLPGGNSDWNFIPPFVIAPSDPAVLYAGSRNVYKTTNRGNSWTAANDTVTLNGTTIACIGVSWTSADTLMTATGSGTVGGNPDFEVFASTSGGEQWTNVTGSLPDRYPTDIEFDPSDSRTAYLTYSGYGTPHVYRTTDLGSSWSDISSNLPDIPVQAVTVDPLYPEYLYVGTDLGVFQSSDGGVSWWDYSEGMVDAMVLDLTISRSNEALRAATFGNGVYQRPLPRFPAVTLLSPAGGELLVAGAAWNILWSAAYLGLVRIDFSADGGATWEPVADSLPAGDGSYAWSVPFVQTDSGVLRVSNAEGGSPADTTTGSISIIVNPDVLAGWNMVSVPFTVSDYQKDSLYPTSLSKAFAYVNGYTVRDTLSNGKGYWLKFAVPGFTGIAGDSILTDTIAVTAGWNLIGSTSMPTPVGSITEDPPGIITSPLYGFRNGYAAADTILPGRAYWVKVSSGGSLILQAVAPPSAAGAGVAGESLRSNTMVFTDATGFSQTLTFGPSLVAPGGTEELPPPGPGRTPDIRFAPGRSTPRIQSVVSSSDMMDIHFQNIVPPVHLSWRIDNADEIYILGGIGPAPAQLTGSGSVVCTGDLTGVTLRGANREMGELPLSYQLSHNYPNPFNPATTIDFTISRTSAISVTVYDLSGRKIAVLAEGEYPAGRHEISWDATGHASGIYLFRLDTAAGSAVRKMILLK